MDDDLNDLLMAWFGHEVEEHRRKALFVRLRTDPAFQDEFVQELYLHGKLKAVQSSEPRWLLLADELWWSSQLSPPEHPPDSFERETMRQVREESTTAVIPRGTRRSRKIGAVAVGALAASLVIGWFIYSYLAPHPEGQHAPILAGNEPAVSEASGKLAVLLGADQVQWAADSELRPAAGDLISAGLLSAEQGRFTLAFLNGVLLNVEAPASIKLRSTNELFCSLGRLRAHVPPGAKGFTVMAPGCAVVDLGTEFGVNVDASGRAEVFVFEGQAEVSLLNQSNVAMRSKLLIANDSVEIDSKAVEIRDAALPPANFAKPLELRVPPLALRPAYREAVLASKPWAYWRFESSTDGTLVNEIPGAPSIRTLGPAHVDANAAGNRALIFSHDHPEQYALVDGTWAPQTKEFAIEAWMLPEAFQHATILTLIAEPARPTRHCLLLELTAGSETGVEQPAAVRLLHRWPPGTSGGVNVYSPKMYLPYSWRQVVAQRDGNQLELFVNGEVAGSVMLKPDEAIPASRVLLGRIKQSSRAGTPLPEIRPYVGRLDELALYDRALSPAEIRQHYELGAGALKEMRDP